MRSSDAGRRIHLAASRLARLVDGRPLRRAKVSTLFVHIPRTSGTSILKELGIERLSRPGQVVHFYDGVIRRVTFDHIPPHALVTNRLVDAAAVEAAFVFTVVRDPFTWAASMHGQMTHPGAIAEGVGFSDWLRGIERLHGAARAAHPSPPVLDEPERSWLSRRHRNSFNLWWMVQAWPQHVMLDGIRVDHIGRFERRDETVQAVAERIGVRVAPTTPRLAGQGAQAGALYDAEPGAAALVRRIYAEDFRRFDYDPERVPSARDPDRRGGHG